MTRKVPIETHIAHTTVVVRSRITSERVGNDRHEWTELGHLGPFRGSLAPSEDKVNVIVYNPEYNNGHAIANCRA